MKKLNKLAVLFATVAVAGSAMASGSTTASDNWRNNHGNLQWKNGTNELCWRNNFWTPATAAPGCDGAIVAQPEAPQPQPQPMPQQAVTSKVTYAADAFFDFDKSVLKPAGRASLDDLVAKIQGINVETIISTGHTDSIGKDAYNQRLSLRRANAVKAYLVNNGGVAASRIRVAGRGEANPVSSCGNNLHKAELIDCLQPDRRVEVSVSGMHN